MELSAFVDPLGQNSMLDMLGHNNNLLTKCFGFCITFSLCSHHHFTVHFIPIILQNFNFGLSAEELVANFLLHKLDLSTKSPNFYSDSLQMNIFFKEWFENL